MEAGRDTPLPTSLAGCRSVMAPAAHRTCCYCHIRQRVELGTDGGGNLVEGPLPCGCAERRRRRICLDCSRSVSGRAWRCEGCKAAAKRKDNRKYRERHPDRVEALHRRRNKRRREARRRDPARVRAQELAYKAMNRSRINANSRRRMRDPEARARIPEDASVGRPALRVEVPAEVRLSDPGIRLQLVSVPEDG